MRIVKVSIKNFRSIKAVDEVRIEPMQAFVGENNAGKSNILRAFSCFLSPGSGGMTLDDFNDPKEVSTIEIEFGGLSEEERKRFRTYLIGDRLILQKQLKVIKDDRTGKTKVEVEYHGYRAEPSDWWLSMAKIAEKYGGRPNYEKIASDNNLLEYAKGSDGKVSKGNYEAGLAKYLAANLETKYDEPELGKTQALGIAQNLLSTLPEFYLLPAITDYSNEIDRRSSSTVFRRLMADLSDRIIRSDKRYSEIESSISALRKLLNPPLDGEQSQRLDALGEVEGALQTTINKLMPAVKGVQLAVEVEDPKEVFSRGVTIKLDDGVITDVLDKGNGLQRSLIFSLLQMLIKIGKRDGATRPIVLGIEEPELYIHPHAQRLIYSVLKEFSGLKEDEENAAGTDQVIYTTHSPAFVEVSRYERVGVVQKNVGEGTVVKQCAAGVLGSIAERKGFKLLTCFGLKHNEVFFSRYCVIVEGPEDEVGIIATLRKLGRIVELPDEIGLSVIVSDGKGDIAKFQKVLNAFGISYGVLLELDGKSEADPQSVPILSNLNGNRIAKVPKRVEDILGVGRHFDDQRHAKMFFSEPANINSDMEALVSSLLP